MSLPENIVLVPSAAFGDGRHPTTRMCLQAVRAFAPAAPFRMLDVGSGTGVLAILAVKRGASAAIGVEIDEEANRVATRNATNNGVGTEATFASSWPEGAFELVVANILRDVLLALRTEILARVADGGTLVLSGLTSTDVPVLIAAYAPLLDDTRPDIFASDDWRTLVWRRVGMQRGASARSAMSSSA
jgi:ribosomal protein L11 methyltransferase